MSKKASFVTLTLLAIFGPVPWAMAAQITFSITGPAPLGPPGAPFAVPGFSTELGTLEAVDLSLDAAPISVSGLMGFNGDTFTMLPQVVQGRLTETHILSVPGRPSIFLSITRMDDASTIVPVPFLATRPITFDLPAASAGPLTLTSPSDLQFFTQEGNVTLNAATTFRAMPIGPGASGHAILGFPSTPVNVTATLTYTFTPVPEPSTLTLVGVGLLACCWWRRRAGRAP